MDPWLLERLACPRDRTGLRAEGGTLVCEAGHRYPVVDGVPLLLVEEDLPAHPAARHALDRSEAEAARQPRSEAELRAFVAASLLGTSGNLYRRLATGLTRWPIPEIRLPPGAGAPLLDLGCNWGRWSVSAARLGYTVVGLDPSLPAVLAARQVAAHAGCALRVVVGDGRHLPFRDGAFDVVFSYSVLQHFSPDDAGACLREVRRVLARGGRALIQMANRFGLRNLYQQARRAFRTPRGFEVRYWTPTALRRAFETAVGPSSLEVDGFFTLNAQRGDLDLLPAGARLIVRLSDRLRGLSRRLPWLLAAADSLYVRSSREP